MSCGNWCLTSYSRSQRRRAAAPSAARRIGVCQQLQQRRAQRDPVAVGHEHAGIALVEQVGDPADGARNNGRGAGHRLQDRPRIGIAVRGQAHHVGLLLEVEQAGIGRLQAVHAHTGALAYVFRRDEVELHVAPEAIAERRQEVLAALLPEAPADEQHARARALASRRGAVVEQVDAGMVLDHAHAGHVAFDAPRTHAVRAITSAAAPSARRSIARARPDQQRVRGSAPGATPASSPTRARWCPSTARPAPCASAPPS